MRRFLTLLLLLASVAVRADIVENLHDVLLEVEAKSAEELERAAKEGLTTVLVRVSGSGRVAEQPQLQPALRDARKFLLQYRFEELEQDLYVSLKFSPKRVEQLLRDAGLPVWSNNRPPLLVWAVIDDRSNRRFVSAERDPGIIAALENAARRRGVKLTYPLLDIQDSLLLTPQQLWNMDVWRVLQAAQRYGTDNILVGRLSALTQNRLLGDWAFIQGDQRHSADADGRIGEGFGLSGVGLAADRMAERYAIAGGGADSSVLLAIEGADTFPAYAALLNYLESVAGIQHANPEWVAEDLLLVRLVLEGAFDKVQRFFDLDKKLEALTQPRAIPGMPDVQADPEAPPAPPKPQFRYRWRGDQL